MKITVRSSIIAVVLVSIIFSMVGMTGCALNKDKKAPEKPSIYDFIGGGKPELNGKKY